jgi:hypothetical protein
MKEHISIENAREQNVAERNVEIEEKERKKNAVFRNIRERWVQFMLGRRDESEMEYVDINQLMPDMEKFFGQKFTFTEGSWWQTMSVLGVRELYYPREFSVVSKNVSAAERERQERMLKGGLLHEAGHHAGIVKVLEKFLYEADTQQEIITELPFGTADRAKIDEAFRLLNDDPEKKKALEQLSITVNIGPHLGNLPLVKDLENIVLDVWLEAYEKQHPDISFRSEAEESLDEVNRALFSELPQLAGSGALLSSQFRTALVFKKGATSENSAWGDGFDAWFEEGIFDEEVQGALEEIIPAYGSLESREGIDTSITPPEMIRWIKKTKFENGYLPIRAAYLKLLKLDIQRKTEQQIEDMQSSYEKGDGKINNEKPISFDDLDPEMQAKILNQILDQINDERVGHDPIDSDDKASEIKLGSIARDTAIDKINERKRKQNEHTSAEEKDNTVAGVGTSDPGHSVKTSRAASTAARESRERQRHKASDMERANLLGISIEQLREYERRKMAMSGKINYLSKVIAEALRQKIAPQRRVSQTEGKLMRGRLPEFLRAKSRGEEPHTHEFTSFKEIIPGIDVLFLFDHSSSMNENKKNEKAADVALLVTESFLRAEREVKRSGVSVPSWNKEKDIMRFGMITFSDSAQLRRSPEEPLSPKSAAEMFFTSQEISGGGTADAKALNNLIQYLENIKKGKTLEKNRRSLAIVIIFTDGEGEREEIQKVLESAGSMKDRLFFVIGAGTGTNEVLSSYGGGLKNFPVFPMYVPDEELDRIPERIIQTAIKPLRSAIAKL